MNDISLEDIQQTISDEELDKIKLTPKQKRYIDEFMVDMDYFEAYKRVFKTPEVDSTLSPSEQQKQRKEIDKKIRGKAKRLLMGVGVASTISRNLSKLHNSKILSSQQILELYSAIARGEVLDQFGLEASLGDRIKALDALAKRQIDFQQKLEANSTTSSFDIHIINTSEDNK